MTNATTALDEKALAAGHAPDWGSVFKLISLPDEQDEQKPYDVKVEAHGTFVVLDFKTVIPDDFVMVTLDQKETGAIEAAFLNEDPATTQWNDVIVNGLTPGTEHILQIHAAGKLYGASDDRDDPGAPCHDRVPGGRRHGG